jgi:hypothetical protein
MNLLSKLKTHRQDLLTFSKLRCETIGGGLYSLMPSSANLLPEIAHFLLKEAQISDSLTVTLRISALSLQSNIVFVDDNKKRCGVCDKAPVAPFWLDAPNKTHHNSAKG